MRDKKHGRFHYAVLFTVFPMALAGPLGKLALGWGAAPLVIALWRLLAATAGTLVFALVSPASRRALARLTVRDAGWSALAGLLLAAHYFCWYSSLERTTIFNATVLCTLQPFFALAGGWLLYRERVRPAGIAAICLAVTGAVVMGFLSAGRGGRGSLAGDALALFTALFFTGYMLCGQAVRRNLPAAAYMALLYGSCAVFLAAGALFSGIPLMPADPRIIGVSVLLALTATFLCHSIFNWAVPHVGTVYITIVSLAEPVGATILGWVMFREAPSPLPLAGGALVVAGVLLYLLYGMAPARGRVLDTRGPLE